MRLVIDEQSCFLQFVFNNHLDIIGLISNGDGNLFDNLVFSTFLTDYLNF
nr:hypothetical protein [Mucilaginibacter sp. FT3.2]